MLTGDRIIRMGLYTRTGDEGETGLASSRRVAKYDPRIATYGTVDELNAFVGLLRAEDLDEDLDQKLGEIQNMLFEIGANLASEGEEASLNRIRPGIAKLEDWIDACEEQLEPLRNFVLPGGHRTAALLHVLRTICRRAEREVWSLSSHEKVPVEIGIWLNRLSDLFFAWARDANRRHKIDDTPWERNPE